MKSINFTILAVLITCFATEISAQQWARKMFKATSHDFGTVAANSKSVYEFTFQNLYKEDVRIHSVRSSCGCTEVSVKNGSLKSWETGAIVAKFNTDKFRGNRSATVTVVIDKPFPAEVQLLVKGNIRGDISMSPGAVNFDEIKFSRMPTKKIQITKYGNINWKIEDVKSYFTHIGITLKVLRRDYRSVTYEMSVTPKTSAPEGFFNEQLIVFTNDPRNRRFPISISGKVPPLVEMSPNLVSIGAVKPGEVVKKKVLLKSEVPFQIQEITCDNTAFSAKVPQGQKRLHFVEVSFKAGQTAAEIKDVFKIKTNLNKTLHLHAVASVSN